VCALTKTPFNMSWFFTTFCGCCQGFLVDFKGSHDAFGAQAYAQTNDHIHQLIYYTNTRRLYPTNTHQTVTLLGFLRRCQGKPTKSASTWLWVSLIRLTATSFVRAKCPSFNRHTAIQTPNPSVNSTFRRLARRLVKICAWCAWCAWAEPNIATTLP